MGDYNSTPISQLPPGSVTLATDLYPATDVTDETESPSGTTKKYAVGQLQTFLTNFTDVTTSPQQCWGIMYFYFAYCYFYRRDNTNYCSWFYLLSNSTK